MRSASLFSGALGLDLGLEAAGFHAVAAVESDRHAAATIRRNRPGVEILTDAFDQATLARLKELGPFDLVCGGPPCQSWSHAGKRLGLDDNRGLCIPRFIDIVALLSPEFVVMENVHGLMTASIDGEKGAVVRMATDRLSRMGYAASVILANAADFWTPQSRKRVVILARLGGPAPSLEQTHAQSQQPDLFMGAPLLAKWLTLKDAIGDRPKGDCAAYPESKARFFRMIKPGQDWRSLPEAEQEAAMGNAIRSGGGRTGFFRRLSWERPSPTLTCSPLGKANAFCHPDEVRPLNVAEYARVQGFPDSWRFEGPLMARYRQIGNAVPVQLGEAIGRALSESS